MMFCLQAPKLTIIVNVLAFVGSCLLLASPSVAEGLAPVFVFNGTDDDITEPFTVGEGWSVEWSADDGGNDIVLKGTAFRIPSTVASVGDSGRGSAVYARSGIYHFEVTGKGRWRIEVFEETSR